MGGSSSPKPPKPTAEEKAMEYRTNLGLKNERERTEKMLKQQAQGKIGVKSMLGGIEPDNTPQQKDVVHSDAISSERAEYNKANMFKKARLRQKYGAAVLGLPTSGKGAAGMGSKLSLLRFF